MILFITKTAQLISAAQFLFTSFEITDIIFCKRKIKFFCQKVSHKIAKVRCTKKEEHIVLENMISTLFFTVFHNALMSVASLLMCFADVFEHCCVLFFIHRTPSPLYSGGYVYAKKRTRFVYCCWLVYFKADNL